MIGPLLWLIYLQIRFRIPNARAW